MFILSDESDGGNNSPIGIPSTVESLAHKEPDNVLDKVLLAIQTDSMGIFHHSYILHDIAQNAELIDHNVLKELEESGLINTWSGGQLFPLKTTTKRSLTNAITMALWGRKDGNNSIGIALQQFLEKNREKFQSFPILPNDNKQTDVGHTSSLKPLKRVKLLKRHLVALSNLIRRPIVVFSKEELHGIYPPLFHEFLECMRCPLFLGYSNKRFSALVAKTRTGKVPLFLVPIHGDVDSRFKEITRQYIRYMNHNGIDVELEKLKDCFRVDINILMALETAQSINWWKSVPNCAYLRPLITSGNGNCLLNAIALALYGNEDFSLILRRALNEFILTPIYSEPLQRRWRVAQTQLNERDQFCLTDEQWLVEWHKILNSSSTSPKNEPKGAEKSTYEFLESIHIFALANLIRRPIIVFASYEIASRDIIGLYLPILFPPNDSYHTPLFLGFDSSHFVLLIPHSTPTIVPISNTNGFILPVLFLQDHSSQQCRDITPIVNEYLTIKLIRHDDKLMVCAAIDHKYASEKLITFM